MREENKLEQNNEKLRVTVQKMKVRVTKSHKVAYIAIQDV